MCLRLIAETDALSFLFYNAATTGDIVMIDDDDNNNNSIDLQLITSIYLSLIHI